MDVLSIHLESQQARPHLTARIAINGHDLIEEVAAVEARFAGASASGYEYPSARSLLLLDDAIGEDEPFSREGGREVTVLICNCGIPTCWTLLTTIVATPETVTWHQFRQSRRDEWSYQALGPFVFDREQYDDVIIHAINEAARLDP
ncbi:MAG: hypothetical protein M3081_08490 [Gemmatimonadota bacterium]|nr:hypothetical protein [Gemmatimonadota bacterium]